MDKHDVIKHMGRFPDVINPTVRMMSKRWECSKCGYLYVYDKEVKVPSSPCECGSIFWTKREAYKHEAIDN